MFGKRHIHLHSTNSTNIHARRYAMEGAEEGTLVTADQQTSGRGRLDRTWNSDPGVNLLASFILRPSRPVEDWGGIPLACGIAVVEAVRALHDIDPSLKWPNDVIASGRKLAGILVEAGTASGGNWCIAGIGVNVNQSMFPGEYRLPPTSLLLETGRLTDIDAVRVVLCRTLEQWYGMWDADGTPAIVQAWKSRTRQLGQMRTIEDGSGLRQVRILDVNDDGSLLVEESDGSTTALYSGDISIGEEEGME